MNNFFKVIVSILGAFNVVFSIFIPISLVLIMVKTFDLTSFNILIVLIIGLLSSLYRAVKFLIVE